MIKKDNTAGFVMANLMLVFLFGCIFLLIPDDKIIRLGLVCIVVTILFFIVIGIRSIRSKYNNITKNTNKTSTPIQSNTEPVTPSTSFDVQTTKQYPVLHDIQNIISNLSQLETDNDLDKNMFVKFHVIKDQYDADYQKTIKILNKLKIIEQFDETYLTIFNHYLDLFKNEQNTIYEKIKQQYNNELNIIDDKLHHFNEMIDKVL